MSSVSDIYHDRVARGELAADPAQVEAAGRLDALCTALKAARPKLFSKPEPPKGLYIWGAVGRGKSMLMDLFHAQAPVADRLRVHFHDFMLETHAFIAEWRKMSPGDRKRHSAYVRKAEDDPIQPAAKQIADRAKLLCFDEFHVTDIADAMILGRLFESLWARGVVVVATSNRAPDDLYRDGVNRQLFVPFINMIKQHCDVMELRSVRDYRLERLTAAPVFYSPLGGEADQAMDKAWTRMTDGLSEPPVTLTVQGRSLVVDTHAEGCARFSFKDLCDRPLGAADYLALARQFHTVFIDHTPKLSPANGNAAKRFVTLVDALYEARTKLVMSADAAPERLYPEGDGAFEFERTVSRLHEMQSVDYLGAERVETSTAD